MGLGLDVVKTVISMSTYLVAVFLIRFILVIKT